MKDEIIRKWMGRAIEKINDGDYTQSIHVYEFIKSRPSSPDEILYSSIETWNSFCENIHEKNLEEVQLFLQLSLKENKKNMNGSPKNIRKLIQDIDILEEPEIILYKPYDPFHVPMIEFYRSPLLFDLDRLNNKTRAFYKEYRSIDDLKNKQAFTRELNFIFSSTGSLIKGRRE